MFQHFKGTYNLYHQVTKLVGVDVEMIQSSQLWQNMTLNPGTGSRSVIPEPWPENPVARSGS
jgi:hypothetical protein